MTVTTRTSKGTALTYAEMDANLSSLDSDRTVINNAMTIDSVGRILTPARPAFRARIAGSTDHHGDTGTLVFETEDFDIGGNYNTSTGIFTAPIAGIYHFMFRSLSATNAAGGVNTSGEAAYGDFYKNGSALAGTRFYAYHSSGGSWHGSFTANSILQLSPGDEIKAVIVGEFAYSNIGFHPCFEGYLIG